MAFITFTGCCRLLHVLGPSQGNADFQLPLKILPWIEVQRLARPLQDLEMLFMSLVVWGRCLPSLSCRKIQPRLILSALTEGKRCCPKSHIHPVLNTSQSINQSLCRKAVPRPNASQWLWCSWEANLHHLHSKHGEWCLYQRNPF